MLLQRLANRGIRLGTLFERAASRHPTNVLILDHDLDIAPGLGRRATVTEIADLVDDFAARLWAAKVRPGERVVVHKSNSFDITLLACAVARVGAVPVLLSPTLDGGTVAELVARAGRPFLVTDEAKLAEELPAAVLDTAQRVLLTSGDHEGATPLASFAGAERVPTVTMPAGHPALITHTSGTTGTPKLAVHTGRTLQARYRPQAAALAPLVPKRETTALHVSFVHSRLFTALAISLLRGFPVLVLADSGPRQVADLFARLRPGILEAHPNSFMEWEQLADDPRRPLANVKLFSSTFDAIHPRTVHRLLHATRRRAPLFGQLYGQSEIGPAVVRAFTRRRTLDDDGRCVGMPFPGMTDVRVVSRDGNPPSETNPGYIEVRSDGRIVTYLGERDRYDQQVSHDGWWRMGDVGYRTAWGCVHLLDREVDLIEGFGSTLAAEDTLIGRLDQLTEVIIVRGPDGRAVPVVCTKNDEPLDPAAWNTAAATLAPMARPVQWRIEDLPQTATTKIKRLELAGLLAAGILPAPGREAPGTDAPGTDALGTDALGTDALGRDAPGRDAPGRDAPGRDAPGRDALGTDAPGTDALGRGALGTDALGRGALGTDALGRDASGTDALGKDAPGKGAPGSDALGKDAPGKGAPSRDALGTDAPGTDALGTDAPGTSRTASSSPRSVPAHALRGDAST